MCILMCLKFEYKTMNRTLFCNLVFNNNSERIIRDNFAYMMIIVTIFARKHIFVLGTNFSFYYNFYGGIKRARIIFGLCK